MAYFNFHKGRFQHFETFLSKNFPLNAAEQKLKVLDIGSHYLYTSMILSQLNFEVDGMDVPTFWNLEFVKNRALKFGITPIIQPDLANLPELQTVHARYDLIVFTEIFEHITFNPVRLWKTIYQMLKPGGKIYISTPNSLALPNLVRNFKNLVSLKSIGISVYDVLTKVTYGHHWKEYSAQEIRLYFQALSDDFEVSVFPYYYKDQALKPPYLAFKMLSKLGNMTNLFADELQVIVEIKYKKNWKMKVPEY